VAKIEEY